MKTTTLREALRRHYEQEAMSVERQDRLAQAIGRSDAPSGVGRRRIPTWGWTAVAALLVGGAAVIWHQISPPSAEELTRAVGGEIALNHRKHLPVEFTAERIDDLAPRMSKLDFAPVTPRGLESIPLRLVGARYCSVGQCIAVQIQAVDEEGRRYTLYQARVDATLERVLSREIIDDGVRVRLWREGDLLMGLATLL